MQRALLFAPLVAAAVVVLVSSCGGSASETPWPAEPDPASIAPAGEGANPAAIVDAGPSKKP